MNFLSIIPYYLAWHYSRGLRDYFKVWKNILWFVWNFFSITILLKTFFAPFKRLKEKYQGGLDIENFFTALITTTIMRLVGMTMRAVVIAPGLVAFLVCFFGGLAGIIIWIVLPFILGLVFVVSLIGLIKK